MSRTQSPVDPDQSHRSATMLSKDLHPVSVYYMDYRESPENAPNSSELYQYTPTVEDLLRYYTHVGASEGHSLSHVFSQWNTTPNGEPRHPDAWRNMQPGDIIIFDGTPFLIRPAGYDKLTLSIPE